MRPCLPFLSSECMSFFVTNQFRLFSKFGGYLPSNILENLDKLVDLQFPKMTIVTLVKRVMEMGCLETVKPFLNVPPIRIA